MLGQIEREESSPTIATLWKIASGFHTSFSSFLEDLHPDEYGSVVSSQQVHQHNEKIRVTALFPFDETLHCEIFALELLPAAELLSAPHEPGVIEHVIVVAGSMDVLVNGKWQTLQQGGRAAF